MKIFLSKFIKVIILVLLAVILILPDGILAGEAPATTKGELQKLGSSAGFSTAVDEYSLSSLIGSVISVLLGFLGVIFVVLIIFAGYNWMTAGGDEDKVTKAKGTISRAVIGLIIVIGSYAIWYLIYDQIIQAR